MSLSNLPLSYCTNVHPGRTVAEIEQGLDRYTVNVAAQFGCAAGRRTVAGRAGCQGTPSLRHRVPPVCRRPRPTQSDVPHAQCVSVRRLSQSAREGARLPAKLGRAATARIHGVGRRASSSGSCRRTSREAFRPCRWDIPASTPRPDFHRRLRGKPDRCGRQSAPPRGRIRPHDPPRRSSRSRAAGSTKRRVRSIFSQTGSGRGPPSEIVSTRSADTWGYAWTSATRRSPSRTCDSRLPRSTGPVSASTRSTSPARSSWRTRPRTSRVAAPCATMSNRVISTRPRRVLADGRVLAVLDLDQALADPRPEFLQAQRWRVHFHVPVDAERLGPLKTTRADLRTALAAVEEPAVRTASRSRDLHLGSPAGPPGCRSRRRSDPRAGGDAIASRRAVLVTREAHSLFINSRNNVVA